MKTIYSKLVVIILLCFTQASIGQTIKPGLSILDGPFQATPSLVENPPDNCSFRHNITTSEYSSPCSIYGFATVIPIVYAEPCDTEDECPSPPSNCPARAGLYYNSRWPLGCLPIQIVDYSHAHYNAPFLFATFSGTVYLMLLNNIIDQASVSVSRSEQVSNQCCVVYF